MYAVTLILGNDAEIVSGNMTQYTYGIGATLPTELQKNGYNFHGWYEDEACKGERVTAIAATDLGNKTFYAKWAIDPLLFLPLLLKFDVEAPATATGGDILVSKASASAGNVITVTAIPNAGYEIDTVSVRDAQGNEIKLTKVGLGTYTFKMPMKKVIVSADFKKADGAESIMPATCPKDPSCLLGLFTDLTPGEWYHDGIHFCLTEGLMGSTHTDKMLFEPGTATSRAMLITILWRLEGKPIVNYAMNFADVAAEDWYAEAVRWAAAEKIVEGYDGAFHPNDALTREQLAAILWRYGKGKGIDVSTTTDLAAYGDAPKVSDWAAEAMQWVVGPV